MKRHQKTDAPHEDFKRCCQQMHKYQDSSVRMIYEYYKDDLINILGNIDTHAVLRQLSEKNVLNAEDYMSIANECEGDVFPAKLYQDILDLGREAVIGFWECLSALWKDYPSPNLLAVLNEINHTGEDLVQQILLDEHGHPLDPDLKASQNEHKQHLLKKTENLVEHRPPGTTKEPQEFYLNERYVNLIVVSTDEFRERPQNELKQTGAKHEECLKKMKTGLEHIFPNKLFRRNHKSQCVPHAVMVSGVPGIGKTTLVQKFVYDWVTGKHYQRFAFVFFFRFRDLNRLGEVSLEDMILHQYPYLENQIGSILEHPERLLFLFDGLDESIHQMDFRRSKLSNSKVKENLGEIVVSLVRQRLLKDCSIMITSRPTKLTSVDTDVFQRIAEIMGFLYGDRLIYFKKHFGNEELSEKAFQYVHENDTLYTYCYIPSYCWIICTVLSMCFRDQPTINDQMMTSLPKTVTQLFVTFVSNILANNSQTEEGARELLTSIGWMAEDGVMNHMLVFDKRHLESFSVRNDNHLSSCFLMESGQPPELDYTFLHLTLQEFFAALVHFINYSPDNLQKSLNCDSYKDGRAEIFLQFLCGLSDSSTRSMLKSHVGELSTQAARHVISWIKEKIEKRQTNTSEEEKRALLNIFHCLKESRNKDLALQCLGSRTRFELSDVPLNPIDCSVLSFILESSEKIEELSLNKCRISAEGVRKLLPALHGIKELSLTHNNLHGSCTGLASGIRNNQTLKTLDLSDNNLEGPDISELMEVLPTSQIENLYFAHNNLHGSGTDLASGIRNNQTLKTLYLSHNNLEGPDISELMEVLPTSQIENLFLAHDNLHGSCTGLASGIRNNQTLKTLYLSDNNLEGPDISELMEVLPTSQIENLDLAQNNLHGSGTDLASRIRNNQTLKILDLSDNNLEGPDISELMEALPTSQIENLYLSHNKLTEESCTDLASGIRNNKTLRGLFLNNNNLEGPHFRDLMTALSTSQIETLWLSETKLTDRSCVHLASGIRNNKALNDIDLSSNNLVGPHLSELMTSVTTSSIKELKICGKGISSEAVRELQNTRPGLTVHIK
ncbi:NACHT, LRR and PYD domains-containing protein 3-like isoform X4 [Lithobates pipiens]